EVLNPGLHNRDQGPDFFNARIRIGDTVWAGNVEIHLRSSDWLRHRHQSDDHYNNVVLHVVGQNDAEIRDQNGRLIPASEIKCPPQLLERYQFLMRTDRWLPCQSYIADIDPFVMQQWYESLAVERLECKTATIAENLRLTQNNWEESFYYTVAQSFGFKTNSQPFLMLAQSLPLNVIAHHKNNLTHVEALLFGQAGLLPAEPTDDYTQLLVREYNHLKTKYKLEPVESHVWKFARMRPGNLPTVRIAQLASLISKSSALLSKMVECQTVNDVERLFSTSVSEYWVTHYVFGKTSARKDKNLGDSSLNLLVINAFVPFMFHYGKNIGKPELIDRAMQWLEDVPDEKNTIISQWEKFGIKAKCALESQALIQLANCYCHKKQCLKCRIGRQVISPVVR
ncbi:MAG: DUF2851 family protein, partial [Salinivirgaceae bacterium]|nr:DUF2851 family protein [Salinivirgaceae bacterium]